MFGFPNILSRDRMQTDKIENLEKERTLLKEQCEIFTNQKSEQMSIMQKSEDEIQHEMIKISGDQVDNLNLDNRVDEFKHHVDHEVREQVAEQVAMSITMISQKESTPKPTRYPSRHVHEPTFDDDTDEEITNQPCRISSLNPLTPAKLGLRQWDQSTSIMDHINQLKLPIQVHLDLKIVTSRDLANMILLTLPSNYSWIHDSISNDEKDSMDIFLSKLIRLIYGDSSTQLRKLIDAQRRPTEHPLAFLGRLKQLYESSTGKALNNEPFALQTIYSKLQASLDRNTNMELKRKTDPLSTNLTNKKMVEQLTEALSMVNTDYSVQTQISDVAIEAFSKQFNQWTNHKNNASSYKNNNWWNKNQKNRE